MLKAVEWIQEYMKLKTEHLILGAGAVVGLVLIAKHMKGSEFTHHASGRLHPMARAHLGRVAGTPLGSPGIANKDWTWRGGAASPMSGEIGPWSPITAKNRNVLLAHTPTNKLLPTARIGLTHMKLQGAPGFVEIPYNTIVNYM